MNDKKINRRDFLQRVGMIGAAGVTLSLFPWLESCSSGAVAEMGGEQARIGVIGTGSRGCFHISNLLTLSNAKVTALCDTYQPHLDDASALCPDAKRYPDYRRLLEDREVDAVVIATPLHLHARITIDSLAAGKHVLCEKAMAYTMEDCRRMYDAWKASGLVMLIGQQRLFDPKYIRAMEMIQRGDLGDVVNVRNYWFRNNDWKRPVPADATDRQINWRLYREYSRGLMTELACHQLQNGSWALGGMQPASVMGSGSIVHWKDGREVFDNVCVIYTYPNGVNMTFESVISNKHFGMGEQILGTKGTVELTAGRLYSEAPRPRSGIRQLVNQIEAGVLGSSIFAGTSWNAEMGSTDPGVAILAGAANHAGESSIGAMGDGSVELLQAFCHAAITGKQPPKVTEEAYYASIFSLLGDEAMLRGEILTLPGEFKLA